MNRFDGLLRLRVRLPSVFLPHGLIGDGIPIGALPSPPPCGWSTGFIAEPRTVGRLPDHRLRPALPIDRLSWSTLPTRPIVARHRTSTIRISPDGSFSSAYPLSRATNCASAPALRASCPPLWGVSSTQ